MSILGPGIWILVLMVSPIKVLWGHYLSVSRHLKFFLIHPRPHKIPSISNEIAVKRLLGEILENGQGRKESTDVGTAEKRGDKAEAADSASYTS